MALGFDMQVGDDLGWFFRRDFEGEMGRRSIQGGTENALNGLVGGGGVVDDDRRVRAATRERGIRRRLRPLSPEQYAVLRSAFGAEIREGLECYGEYPAVLFASLEVARLHRESHTTSDLPTWVVHLAHVARKVAGENGHHARQLVGRLRRLAEDELADALRAYGTVVERRADGDLSLREIAAVTGQNPKTVLRQIRAEGMEPEPEGSSHAVVVKREELRTMAPGMARVVDAAG